MMSQRTRSRKQRMFDRASLFLALTAFAYAFWPRAMGGLEDGFWGVIGISCAVGGVAALVWFEWARRSPDDGRPYVLEPDPSRDPATRGLRVSVFGVLVILGITAFVAGVAGLGFGGAMWWRAVLFSFSCVVFLTGAFGLVLALREGRAVAPTASHRT